MRAAFPILALYVSTAHLLAQSVVGSGVVSGRVLDQYGEGMPDAVLTVENEGLGVRRALQTSLDGVFEVAGLPPSPGYRIQVTHERYRAWHSPEFEVQAGRHTVFRIAMQPEQEATDRPSVVEPSRVDHTNAPVGVATNVLQLDSLPAPARRWDTFVLLAPAVAPSLNFGVAAMRGDAASTSYFTDGLFTTNRYPGGHAAPAGRLSADAVQALEVLSAAAPVEFGHAMGGFVNVVTRSGGNNFHGRVYDYFSNDALNALGRYALGRRLFGRRHQSGFDLGGSIVRSKLFFFSNLEILEVRGHSLNRITNPLIADSAGTRVAPSNCRAGAAPCAAAIRFLENQMNVLVPGFEHAVSGLLKGDYRRSDRNSVSFTLQPGGSRFPLGAPNGSVSAAGGLLGTAASRQDTYYGKLEWINAPSSTSSNEFRLGLFHDRLSNGASNTGLSTGPVSVFLAGSQVGEAYPNPSIRRERRLQLVDHLRASFGSQTFLIGIDWTRTQDWISALADGKGSYYYSSLTAFAQDLSGGSRKNYTWFTQTLGNPVRKLSTPAFGFYLQDEWNVSPRLRLTGGVRWSKQFPAQPAARNPAYFATGEFRSPNINADPRIGAAYLLGPRTVFRASFGLYHAPHSGELIDAVFLGNGIYQSRLLVDPLQAGSPLFPAAVASAPAGTVNILSAASKLRNPYTKQTTFAIERYVGGGLTVTASYVGSRGVKLWTVEDLNLGATRGVSYAINSASGTRTGTFDTLLWTTRVNPGFAHVYQITNGGSSWYRGLVLQAAKRMGRGLHVRASYTWSHAIDDVGGERIAGSLPVSTYNADHRADLGSSAYDQRHRAVFDWLWQPRLSGGAGVVRSVLNGWEISSIAALGSSQPHTAMVVTEGRQFSTLAAAFPGSLNGSGGWSRVPFLPVGHLHSQPEYTVDARLARAIRIHERVAARIMAEVFNLFNTQFDTGVNTAAYTASGGVLTPVSGLGAGNAARGYVTGSNARSCQIALRVTF